MRNSSTLSCFYPAPQAREAKTVAVLTAFHIHQLNSQTLAADCGIQWWCEYRGQDHIDAAPCGDGHEVLNDPPVFLRENRYMVIVCQTVGMKPLCTQQCLRRQQAFTQA